MAIALPTSAASFFRNLATLAFVLGVGLVVPAGAEEDKTISVGSDDAEMNAAIANARADIDVFWKKYSQHEANETGFAVKLRLTDGENVEHFWCSSIEGPQATATCAIDNDPESVMTVKLGQRVSIEADLISDWMYLRDDKIVGNKTLRVLLKHMEPEMANEFRARFSEE